MTATPRTDAKLRDDPIEIECDDCCCSVYLSDNSGDLYNNGRKEDIIQASFARELELEIVQLKARIAELTGV